MRELYLKMIVSNPDAILQQLALPLKQEFALDGAALGNVLPKPLELAVGSSTVTSHDKEAVSVGIASICDVRIPQTQAMVSRLQCWIFNLPAGILVVDGWSIGGTSLVASANRSADESGPASKPHDRHVLMIPHGEATTIRLGTTQEVTVNPKTCAVCMERPRSVRLACGHQTFCASCMQQLISRGRATCPLCRMPVESKEAVMLNRRAAVFSTVHPSVRPRQVDGLTYIQEQ